MPASLKPHIKRLTIFIYERCVIVGKVFNTLGLGGDMNYETHIQ